MFLRAQADIRSRLTVDVKYTFGSAGGDVSGYSVKIVPHVVEGKDFDFTLDDQVYSFQAETDLTAGFNIAREETSFTITPKSENGNVANVLQAVYPNNTIGGCEDKGYEDMYSLIVTSYNGEASVTLHFSILQDAASFRRRRISLMRKAANSITTRQVSWTTSPLPP